MIVERGRNLKQFWGRSWLDIGRGAKNGKGTTQIRRQYGTVSTTLNRSESLSFRIGDYVDKSYFEGIFLGSPYLCLVCAISNSDDVSIDGMK